MTFYVHQSNRLEILIDRLAALLREPLRSPFDRERVVVQNNGMARWLSLQLADRLGVCAHLTFEFPAELLWSVAKAVLPHVPKTPAFSQAVLNWRVMALLKTLEDTPPFAPLHAYLKQGDGTGDQDFRYYELACHIADCFDQYLIYRPDWIVQWERGDQPEEWQAELWRRLVREDPAHRVQLQNHFLAALNRGDCDPRRLPERVSIIGGGALPPIVLEMLAALAEVIDVHLFVLNPCKEYWGDIQAERDQAYWSDEADPADLYFTVGHPLLAALGKQGRDFIDWLPSFPHEEWEHYVDPDGDDLLHHLQYDILHLKERAANERLTLRRDDYSVQIHLCHSALREVEVLHDQLLALFDVQSDGQHGQAQRFRPTDVLIMTPNINTYAPLIEAIFSTTSRDRKIPFSITDRGVIAENPLVEVFFTLLEGQGRFQAPQILGLLESEAICRRFGMDAADVITIRRWVQDVGIRWGIDAAAKAQWGLPATADHTWRAGLDRLFLGYALPGDGCGMYADILPHDAVEGDDAQALGHLQRFCAALFEWEATLIAPRPWPAWIASLHTMLDAFFDPKDTDERALQAIRTALETLRKQTQLAQFEETIGLEVAKSALRDQINADDSANGQFYGGGVTFCSMVPMRSIPFPVIGLLGMNDEAYPREDQSVSFDLMANKFRRGDRSCRHDDRYLFLEIILAARHCLYISAVGRSIRDDTIIPPSVLVSTLIDTIDRSFIGPNERPARESVIVQHPLQPFSPRYFADDPRRFTYAQEWVEASRHAGHGDQAATPLLSGALPEPEAEFRTVTVERLLTFFCHPTRWLLQERLGIKPAYQEAAPQSREPFVLDALENYKLLQQTLALHMGAPLSAATIAGILRSSGALPHGAVGAEVFAVAQDRAIRFASRVRRARPLSTHTPMPLPVAITQGDFRVGGYLPNVTPHGAVGYRLAKMTAKDYLTLWLHHLILNIVKPDGVVLQSCWIAEDKRVVLEPCADARAYVQMLLSLYWQGTQQLLHFFPKSALAYVETLRNENIHANPLDVARKVWKGNDYFSAESDDPYYQLAFRDSDPLNAGFIALAEQIFSPILVCTTDGEGD